MSVVDIASSQTSSVISFSVEPEHPEAIVDHVLPFIGFGNTECEVNEYIVFPMMTGHYFTFAPSLEACNSRWCPWDESLDPEKLLHFLVTEVGLYVRIQEHLTRHNFVITLSTSSNPDMVKTMPFEVHLLFYIETIELLGRTANTGRSRPSWRPSSRKRGRCVALSGPILKASPPGTVISSPFWGCYSPLPSRQSLMHRHRFIVTDGASIFQQLFSSHRTDGYHLWLLFSF